MRKDNNLGLEDYQNINVILAIKLVAPFPQGLVPGEHKDVNQQV